MAPDKGWRKRLHDKRPKTPVQTKASAEDAAVADDAVDKPIDRSRLQAPEKLGWRKTYHGSRPVTPIASPATPSFSFGGDDTEDSRSEVGSDAPVPRKGGPRPKFSRYISDYLTLGAPPKGKDKDKDKEEEFPPDPPGDEEHFLEPWDDDFPHFVDPPADPELAVVGVRSHICRFPQVDIPWMHSGGLLRLFEDYRKVREAKEGLEGQIQDSLDELKAAKESWATTEGQYQDEIRRLELLIAKGSSGMTGLMKARQGTIIRRRRAQQQTLSTDQSEAAYEFLTPGQLDEQIRQKSQKVIFHRPSSPSGTMAALSRQFSHLDPAGELHVGTPPQDDRGKLKMTLSRKFKSELDLEKMSAAYVGPSGSIPPSVDSGFSISGDPLPDEVQVPEPAPVDPGVEAEAFVALRELATLVARRRGINTDKFVSGVMALLSPEDLREDEGNQSELNFVEEDTIQMTPVKTAENTGSENRLSEHNLRRFRSGIQPQSPDKNRRRHFSFEPGDDQLVVPSQEMRDYKLSRPKSPAGSQSSTEVSDSLNPSSDHGNLSERSSSKTQTLDAEAPKPSKIPSPLHRPSMGSLRQESFSTARRENSTSSFKTVASLQRGEDRASATDPSSPRQANPAWRDSRSSILTAIRDNSSTSLRYPQSRSRSNSNTNLSRAESHHSMRVRSSMVALAAAQAASNSALEKKVSPTKDGKRAKDAQDAKEAQDAIDATNLLNETRMARSTKGKGKGKASENDTPERRPSKK